jgi:hypothetical protein
MIRSLTCCIALVALAGGARAADDHGHEHGAEGHDHTKEAPKKETSPKEADKPAGHHHGDEVALGTKTIGEWSVTANRIGDVVAGKDGAFTVDFVPAKPMAKSVRVWIGSEDGKGAVKAKGEPEKEHPGGWHCHVEVPNPIPEGAKFWVTVETEAGDSKKESFSLTK